MVSAFPCGTIFRKLHKHVSNYLTVNVKRSAAVDANALRMAYGAHNSANVMQPVTSSALTTNAV